jgi:predicted secreted protein
MSDGGFGVTFNIGDGAVASSPTYTAIASVKTWNGVEIASIMSEVTAHDSPGGYREHIPSGLFEVTDIELGLAFDIGEGTHANASGGLVHAMLNKTLLAYQIVLPDTGSTTWTFDAYVQKVKMESPKEEHIMATVTLKITGQPTLA